jgi:hypothetical protein
MNFVFGASARDGGALAAAAAIASGATDGVGAGAGSSAHPNVIAAVPNTADQSQVFCCLIYLSPQVVLRLNAS